MENNIFGQQLGFLRKRAGLSQQELVNSINNKYGTKINRTTISKWENGTQEASMNFVKILADFFNVSLDYINGLTDNSDQKLEKQPLANYEELSDLELIKFPIIGSIAAGYDCCALEEYTGDYAYFPSSELSAPADEYFVLRVKGNSMYPKLLENDTVLVRRKQCVDSGKIAVVLYNGEEATVKRVNYIDGESWLELAPINPEYQAKRIEGSDLEQCRVLGEVVKLMRDM